MTIFVAQLVAMSYHLIKYAFLLLAQMMLITHDLFPHQLEENVIIWQGKFIVLPAASNNFSDSENELPLKPQHAHCCSLDATDLYPPRYYSLPTPLDAAHVKHVAWQAGEPLPWSESLYLISERAKCQDFIFMIPGLFSRKQKSLLFNRPPPANC